MPTSTLKALSPITISLVALTGWFCLSRIKKNIAGTSGTSPINTATIKYIF
jgi:hypothetical protein